MGLIEEINMFADLKIKINTTCRYSLEIPRIDWQGLLRRVQFLGHTLGYMLWVKYYLNLIVASGIKKLQSFFLEMFYF